MPCKDLAQQVGMTVPEDDSSPAERERAAPRSSASATLPTCSPRRPTPTASSSSGSPRAIDYLKGRGLSGEIAAQFGLGYAPEGWRSLASVFPNYDDPLLEESGLVIAQEAEGRARDEASASATTASATASCSRSARCRAT